MRKAAAAIALVLLCISCVPNANNGNMADGSNVYQSETADIKTSTREMMCFNFLKENMLTPEGGIRTNYTDSMTEADIATGAEVLSESVGLLMLYAVDIGDEMLFKRLFEFVERHLDTGNIISYRLSQKGEAYGVNAFIDDIRIVRALILADEKFSDDYINSAIMYADRLYNTNITANRMYDMFDERYNQNNDFITLCYIDLKTVRLLEKYDQKWERVFETMLEILKNGYISDEFPVFAASYSYSANRYSAGDINMIEALLSVLNLASIGECPDTTIDYVKTTVQNGCFYGLYESDGKPKNQIQSTAVYAICALIADELEDAQMLKACINKMNAFQVTDEQSKVYGAFADADTLKLYAFDNLMALLAYRTKEIQ